MQIVPVALGDGDIALCLEGELDYATVAQVRARLRELEGESVVLDLSGVTFTDSAGLALLLEERAAARQRGAQFRVRGVGGQTLELLERTGLLVLLTSAAH